MNLEDKVKLICNDEYKYFLNKENVVGVALGYKITGGFNTLKKCINVLVSKKVSVDKLSNKDIIPKEYKGIQTDVIETRIINGFGFTKKKRPVPGGYSIGPASRELQGTFACLVTDGNKYYVLGCNHTLAGENTVLIDTPILQPSIIDKGRESRDNIAYLTRYIPLQYITAGKEPVNFVDCAIAEVKNLSIVSKGIVSIGKINGSIEAILNWPVKKVGCITELTFGNIIFLNATIRMEIYRGVYLMKNQIGTTAMSDSGDSGALLLDLNNYAVGLLCGGSEINCFYNPIGNVLMSLGIGIVLS